MSEMTERERIVYEALNAAAEACLPAPRNDDLMEMVGCSSDSTPPHTIRRLEEKGLIEVARFQRSRQVCIVATGKCTAMPLSSAPHWRDRPKDVPTPSISAVRARQPDIAAQIMTWAASRSMPICDVLADLVYVGWQVEKERG